MKTASAILPGLTALLLTQGCTTARQTTGDQVAGIIASGQTTSVEARHAVAVREEARKDERIREAYSLGQLQATKSLHQAIQNMQRADVARTDHDGALVPLTVPERRIDGVIINQGVEYVRLPH